MHDTTTSEWKTKLSPRAKGRVQVALPTDESDYQEPGQPGGDLGTKKEFSRTGNFPPRMKKFGLNSGGDKRKMFNN